MSVEILTKTLNFRILRKTLQDDTTPYPYGIVQDTLQQIYQGSTGKQYWKGVTIVKESEVKKDELINFTQK